jgi:putative transposase
MELKLSCDNREPVRLLFALDCYYIEPMSWVPTTKGIDEGLLADLMMNALEIISDKMAIHLGRFNG